MTTGPLGPASGLPPEVVVANLHKGFGPHRVLTGVHLEVPAGSFTAVLGPSGSGKTTLLRVLAGFERPDKGTVTIAGATVDDDRRHVPAERRRIGYVSQEGSLFPHLNVGANVAFGLPRRQRRRQVADLLDAVGLTGLAGRYPHQLSGGQQQRVALARALAVKPQVVLLDEPFASLDANLRASVRADVHAVLRASGTTTVLVTHDQDEALSISDQVAVIRSGTIAQLGSPQDIYADPVDSELAGFVGDANLVDGTFDGKFVVTALGRFEVSGNLWGAAPGPVTVLVRPEQVQVRPDGEEAGVRARVVSTAFYGHDSIVRLAPAQGVPSAVIARVLGDLRLRPGAEVQVTARGPVKIWPVPEGPVPERPGPGANGPH
ncbi:MAG: ABC transporter ATP-binding protein [Acidimicrobiales bacterium]|jgi:iron(III) transport system ATP-binding protein